jgi:nucleoside-diphosphate-sugar epimerase
MNKYEINGKKILVTGGTGFIGRSVVKGLLGKGAKVRVFDNDSRGSSQKLGDMLSSVEMINGDIRDGRDVYKAAEGVDSIVHLAYVNGTEFFYSKPEIVLEVAIKGMMNILDACVEKKVRNLFLASSSEVYQTPPNVPTDERVPLSVPDVLNPRAAYGGGKICAELLTINYGRKFFDRAIIFRPHNVYGPAMGWEHVIPQFCMRAKALPESNEIQNFKIQGGGTETRSYIYIDDFIDGLIKVMENGAHLGIYNIGTQHEVNAGHLAKMVAQQFNKKIQIVPGKLQLGSTARRCPDITKLSELGFVPKVTLSEGLKITAEWYKNNNKTI